jgi:hypothetical protein
MSPWRRHERHGEAGGTAPVDQALRSAADAVLRDEAASLDAERPLELAVLQQFEDVVRNDFVPWAALEADRLAGSVGAARDGVERDVRASYAERFRPTVTALAPELMGRGCLTGREVAQVREAESAPEIVALGTILGEAVRELEERAARSARDDRGDPRARSDDALLRPPYEDH